LKKLKNDPLLNILYPLFKAIKQDGQTLSQLLNYDPQTSDKLIPVAEFVGLFRKMNVEVTKDQLPILLEALDKDKNGAIKYEDFMGVITSAQAKISQLENMEKAVSKVPADVAEFFHFLVDYLATAPQITRKMMFQKLDADGDNKLSRQDILAFIKSMSLPWNADKVEAIVNYTSEMDYDKFNTLLDSSKNVQIDVSADEIEKSIAKMPQDYTYIFKFLATQAKIFTIPGLFTRLDRDGDGIISIQDLHAAFQLMQVNIGLYTISSTMEYVKVMDLKTFTVYMNQAWP